MHSQSGDNGNHIFLPLACNTSPNIVPLKEGAASPGLLRSKKKKKLKKPIPEIKIQNIETPHQGMLNESKATDNYAILNINKPSPAQVPSVAAAPVTKKHIPKVKYINA